LLAYKKGEAVSSVNLFEVVLSSRGCKKCFKTLSSQDVWRFENAFPTTPRSEDFTRLEFQKISA
jgi:hypothetical protein